MQTVIELLTKLDHDGIQLWVDGDQLRFSAPVGAMGPVLQDAVRQHKREIMALLAARGVTAPGIRAVDSDLTWKPTALQERLVRSDRDFNISSVFLWRGDLNIAALESAIDELARRHSALRTRYIFDERDGLLAVTPQHCVVPLELFDLRSSGETEREPRARELADQFVHRKFDYAAGPLLRFAVIRLRSDACAVVYAAHHSVFDAWSAIVFENELFSLYEAAHSGRVLSQLPPPPLQFHYFVQQQNAWLASVAARERLAYWLAKLQGAKSPFALPRDRRTPPSPVTAPLTSGSVSGNAVPQLHALSRQEKVTNSVTIATAFAVVLAQWSGNPDVFTWNVSHGRHREEFHGIIGLFADFWLLRVDLPASLSFREALRRVHAATVEAMPHAVPYLSVNDLLQKVSLGVPHPGVIYNYRAPHADGQTAVADPGESKALRLNWVRGHGRFADESEHAIYFQVTDGPNSISWQMIHHTRFFEDETIARVSAALADVLTRAADDPDMTIGGLVVAA